MAGAQKDADAAEKIEEYLRISESLSVRINMIGSLCFISFQFITLLIQVVIVYILEPDEADPKDTLGLRMAVLSVAVVAIPVLACEYRSACPQHIRDPNLFKRVIFCEQC